MRFKFSESASGPARYVGKREMEIASMTYPSSALTGANAKRVQKIMGNADILSEVLFKNIGLKPSEFYSLAGQTPSVLSKVREGMGFER